MSLQLIVRPEAEADIIEAALWYEGREPGLGLEVTAELHAALERAQENPLSYLLLRKHPHVRRVLTVSLSNLLHREIRRSSRLCHSARRR